jgi:hypothetical protein
MNGGRRNYKRNTPSGSAKVTKNQVKQMIKASTGTVTKKYLNSILYAAVMPATTGSLVTPVLPAQGVTNGEREADSIGIDAIEIRAVLYNYETAVGVNGTDMIRLICVQARASNAVTVSSPAAPTTGVLDLGSSSAIDLTSFINFNAKNELFHVIMDKTFPVNFLSTSASRLLAFSMKPKIEKINFTPGTTTAQAGQIYWIAQTLTGYSLLEMEQRLVYHDL